MNVLALALFSFKGYSDHRDQHSFPTRRSSDLTVKRKTSTPSAASTKGCSVQRRKPSSVAVPFSTRDRKSTRLNSSHMSISYAVFCLKKKKQEARGINGWQRGRAATHPGGVRGW